MLPILAELMRSYRLQDCFYLQSHKGMLKKNLDQMKLLRMITKNSGKIGRNLQDISSLGQKFPRLSGK